MHRLSALLLALFIAAAPSMAQGIVRGSVTNEAGEALTGATVVFRNGPASPLTSTANARGAYTSPHLPAGTYSVTFFAAGYETQRFTAVPMKAGAEIIVNATMAKSGSWGSSIIMHRYVPVPEMVKVKRRKNAYKLTGVYPYGTATIGVSRAAARTVRDEAVSSRMAYMAAPPHPASREEPKRSVTATDRDPIAGKSVSPDGADFAPFRGNVYDAYKALAAGSALPAESKSPSETILAAPAAHAGSLSSGEINDFSKWSLWEDMSMEALKSYRTVWSFRPETRYSMLVKSRDGSPLCNARVKMSNGSKTVWESVTDNTGKAELWYGMWDTGKAGGVRLSAGIDYGGQHYSIPSLRPFAEGANILATNLPCLNPAKLDIAFIVDATGSMQDEIDYLKAELRDILQKVKDSMPAVQVQTGAVFYRDLQDAYITRTSDLTPDFSRTEAFIADNNADGGGDFPEALDAALEEGLTSLHWHDDATTRLAFIVLDAPPHNDSATTRRMQALTAQYASRGIRLIPVVCSGSDKSTEYLMRSIALATNGTYLFLTDHSGIGGSHTAPTTDKYDVEYLNGLIYRVIYQYSYMPACKGASNPQRDTLHVSEPTGDSTKTIVWRYYPNPTTGILHIEHTYTSGYLLVTDVTGKAILRIPADASGRTTIDVGQYPAGIYAIRYNWEGDKWVNGKFIVVH